MKNNIIFYILTTVWMLSVTSCDLGLDEKDDPQALKPQEGSIGPYLVNVQVKYSKFFEELQDEGMEVARMTALNKFSRTVYNTFYEKEDFDIGWRIAFSDILVNTEKVIEIGAKNLNFQHSGVARLMKVLAYLNLVDYFGDIPYSEALQGTKNNFSPKLDKSKDIYASLFKEIDLALGDLGNKKSASLKSSDDLMYRGDIKKWVKFANSLKIKMWVQQRKAEDKGAEIKKIVDSKNYISTKSDDFQFRYSSVSSPESRHFLFSNNYVKGGTDYMSNNFMNLLLTDKKIRDPRLRYYLYRQQTKNTTNPSEKDCLTSTRPAHYGGWPFCELIEGYWGRDHGNPDGTPPDTKSRTIFGFYPIGGLFDANQNRPGSSSDGVKGAGISPILLANYVEFYLAEAALTMTGTGGDAKALLESAMRKSFDKVLNFDKEIGATGVVVANFAATNAQVETYISEVLTKYDAGTDEEKLAIISKEFYLATFCNGFEAYNIYRRTGYPKMQPALSENAGKCIRTFKYPADLVLNNSKVSPKPDQLVRVFWDIGNDDLD